MTGLSQVQNPIGENKYNSLIVRLDHRFAHGLMLNTHYEWAHTMSRDWFPNSFDSQPVWQESDSSRPLRWVVTGVYDLPFGKGRPVLRNSRLGNALVGGWQLGVAFQRQSGECIDFGNQFWYGSDYRDIVLPSNERTQDHWFNTDLFERSSSRAPSSFNRRVFPNRMNWLRTANLTQLDANLVKGIPIRERITASLRLDLINALNHPVIGNPNVNPLDSGFGRVTAFVNAARLIQLTFRLSY